MNNDTVIIGTYGPDSAQIGGLAMFPEEARKMVHELTGKIIEVKKQKKKKWTDFYHIQSIHFWGDEYGQIIARVLKRDWYFPDQRIAPFALNWTPPLQGQRG